MEYDELGQLMKKTLGGGLQDIDYQYNIRGWLTHVNNPDAIGNDLYAQELTYNNPISGISGAAQYNGNISAMRWVTQNSSNTMEQYVYGYEYDDLNRITKGDYSFAALGSSTWNASYEYDLFDVKYDKNGNITYLERGQEPVAYTPRIDKLTYDYTGTGNQLKKVTDAGWLTKGFNSTTTAQGLAEQYTYDKNGNLKTDQNKGINDITYNHLNLPIQVSLAEGTNKINYLYDAAGTKYKKTSTDTIKNRYYFSNFEYSYNENTMLYDLEYIHTPEGCVRARSSYANDFYLKDHLGNTRVMFADENNDGTPEVLQVDNYYPFGMRHNQANTFSEGGKTTQYMYNGKELQEDYNLNWYSFEARMYDPAIVRTSTPDPHAESYIEWSPYSFMGNNPISNIDPTGMDWYSYTDADGNEHYKYQDGSDKTITIGDNTYNNIGASVNIQLGEGYYYNAFQNYGVTSIDNPVNVEQMILGSTSLQGKLLSEGSGFSAQGQAQIMTSLIHQGQDDFLNHPVTQATISGLMFVATGGIEGAASLLSAGRSLLTSGTGVKTTLHGAERIAGAAATRGGVLSREGIAMTKSMGRAITQADGATVYLHEISPGRYNAVVQGSKGIITTMENWSQKSILRIAKNYGWKL